MGRFNTNPGGTISISLAVGGHANQRQYSGQWGEDWLRLVERERLNAQESLFQDFAKQRIAEPFLRGVATPATEQQGESAEMGWLIEHVHELEQHKGEWLLIKGSELVAHDREFARIRELVRERQIDSPFIYYVPTDDESNSITI